MAKKKSHEKEISVTPIDHIRDMDVTEIMKSSYINYAMNVIIARALPDVRDGLKPVHRRVLYAMKELKLTGDAKKKKSARIVGDIIGKYHPHGDSAAYETMVRMAQDFSYRYPLVEGQGNFGSIDGDPAAAMRYTEAKLTPIAEELLNGLDKNTVNFIDNYDSTEKEPVLLPSRYPNLLVNGSTGIAVGMATNMPPHHLGEVVDTTVAYIDNPNIDDEKLISYLNGPDFPTGGVIVGRDEIKKAYLTGKGKITLRGKVTVEEGNSGKPEVVINDIPYGINKPKLLEKIATLIRDGRIEDIMDIRDETDKTGMRIVIELKKGANPKKLINQLFSLTDLQTTFGIINLAVVNGSPEILTLRQILEHYLVFQREVIERRSKFELDKAKARAHILEGLVIVGENVDQVVALIRASRNTETAKQKLMKQFNLSEIQAQAILDLRLHRITGIEVSKTKADLKEIYKSIKRLEKILSTQKEMDNVIKEELLQIKEKFSDQRRTIIIDDINQHNDSFNEMIRKTLIISISKKGYVHAVDEGLFNRQSRGAKGSSGVQITDDDYTQHLFPIATDQVLGLFTSEGQFYRVPASELPEISRNQRGTLVYNLAAMNSDAKVTSYLVFNKDEEHSTLTFITKLGLIKKMDASEILNGRNGILAIKLKKEDELLGVFTTEENEEFILATRKGKSIRFNTSDVRPMGRVAGGVNTISMDKDDYVVGVDLVKNGDFLIVLSELGHGKRTPISEFRLQKRLGKGVRVATFTKKHGELAAIQMATEEQDVLITTDSGKMIRLHVGDFAVMTRDTSGGKVIELNDGDKILSIAVIAKQEE